jgi:hypothetical protein
MKTGWPFIEVRSPLNSENPNILLLKSFDIQYDVFYIVCQKQFRKLPVNMSANAADISVCFDQAAHNKEGKWSKRESGQSLNCELILLSVVNSSWLSRSLDFNDLTAWLTAE